MPLKYDDEPGSWGRLSLSWPRLYGNEEMVKRAYVACTKEDIVPYGSYVKHETFIAVETPELLDKLRSHVNTSKLSYQDVLDGKRELK